MPKNKGTIALMGSGETTSTMVEVHKSLMAGHPSPRAVFIDTPAGFEPNVNQISERVVNYFKAQVGQPMSVASYTNVDTISPFESEQALQILRESTFILIGPGSPTYAVRQWRQTKIPDILKNRVSHGACLVAASAAALTMGRFTLPVYEIYRVGQELHWVEGIDILGRFGLPIVVVPHWNNAEGGTHDTRFCYMGGKRFQKLESLLPDDVSILGIDEHTVCIIDLDKEEFLIKGIGQVTLRHQETETVFRNDQRFPLQLLREKKLTDTKIQKDSGQPAEEHLSDVREDSFWEQVNSVEAEFQQGLETHISKQAVNALLELDRLIWKAQQDFENPELISQARELLRELIVALGIKQEASPRNRAECLAPLVEDLLNLRAWYRRDKQYSAADKIRDSLKRVGIVVEDTENGTEWRIN